MLFVDIETTGPFEHKHCIWNIAAIYDEDGEFKGKFDMKARPPVGHEFDEEALHECGVTEDEIMASDNTQQDLKEMFEAWLGERVDRFDRDDKMFFAAYNSATFDYPFCRRLWTTHEDKFFNSFFWFPDIDVMRIAAWALIRERHMLANFKLPTVAKALGFPFDENQHHSAMYDCRVARNIYYSLEGD